MTKFTFGWAGLSELALFFRLMQKVDFGEAWVGSAVVYGPMQEFGTKFLTERPHWRVAIPEIVAAAGNDVKLQNKILDAMAAKEGIGTVSSGNSAPMEIALLIERRVKQVITAKGIIDTSNYRGSVATGSTEDDAFGKSVSRATDPSSVAM